METKKVEFSDEWYSLVASDVVEAIKDVNWFNNSIVGELTEDLHYVFNCALVVYQGDWGVDDIIPVWWDLKILDSEGNEWDNDFLFATLRDKLKKLCD